MHIHKSQLPDLTLIDVIISRSLPVCAGPAGGSSGEEEEEEEAGERDFQLVRARCGGSGRPGVAGRVRLAIEGGQSAHHGPGWGRREPWELGNSAEPPPAQRAAMQAKSQQYGKDPAWF